MDLTLSSHLLDGSLGRMFALMAVSIMAGIYLWSHVFHHPRQPFHAIARAAIIIGWIGIALSINSTFFELSESFVRNEGAALQWQHGLPLIFQTRYGQLWLAFGGLLLLARRCIPHPRIMLVSLCALIICLSGNGHAADNGMLGFKFFLHTLHLACISIWLGGLMLIVLARYSDLWRINPSGLVKFSNFILPVFLVGLTTGALRLVAEFLENNRLNLGYVCLVMTKVALVLAICVCALGLRRLLRHKTLDEKKYDDILGIEFFLAILLLFAAAMLTQLPPF